ncbi:MAG: alcohol dehydrogenase catalytic domain-containing protein [Blastocatellia bacterium]
MKALKFDGHLRFVNDAPVPRREGEALVQVIRAGICNTDLEIVKGYAGFHGILGHEFVGHVVESPDASQVGRRVVGEINAGCGNCDLCRAGDARHCASRTVLGIKARDGAFAEYLSLPPRNLLEIPDTLADEAAVFVEPLAAACNILEQVNITSSTRVAVIGDGKLAQMIIRVVALRGCEITVIGKHKAKLALASAVGARAIQISDTPADDWLEDSKLKNGFDVAIEASGSRSGLPMALDLVRPRGIVVLKSTHHASTSINASLIAINEITVIGSRCGRFRPALDLLVTGDVDVSPFISDELPIEDGLMAFERAAQPSSLKVVLIIS